MKKKPKTKKAGVVRKIIKYAHQPEKAEIAIPAADELYQEIRIENKLEDDEGKEVKLKQGDHVDITIEADKKDTQDTDKGSGKGR